MMKPLELAVGAVVAIAIAATIADTAAGQNPPPAPGLSARLTEQPPAARADQASATGSMAGERRCARTVGSGACGEKRA